MYVLYLRLMKLFIRTFLTLLCLATGLHARLQRDFLVVDTNEESKGHGEDAVGIDWW